MTAAVAVLILPVAITCLIRGQGYSAEKIEKKLCMLDINSAQTTRADDFLLLSSRGLADRSYEDSSRQMHPSIVNVPGGWPSDDVAVRPWRQWLAVTPIATSDRDENPHLFARADENQPWTYFIGTDSSDSIINPLFDKARFVLDTAYWFSFSTDTVYYDTTDGHHDSIMFNLRAHHLSDPDLFMGHDGRLYIAFRVSWSVSGIDMHAIYCASSMDGRKWSVPTKLTHLGKYMSPAVISSDHSSYVMLCTMQEGKRAGRSTACSMHVFEGDDANQTWTDLGRSEIINHPRGFGVPWHIDVVPRSDTEWIALIQAIRPSALWAGVSSDHGKSWRLADQVLLPSVNDSTRWDAIIYRASGYWRNPERTELELVYSGYCVWDTNGVAPGGEITRWHTGETAGKFSCGQ
jgi:hypothetical protein